jgi:hypothetical protein
LKNKIQLEFLKNISDKRHFKPDDIVIVKSNSEFLIGKVISDEMSRYNKKIGFLSIQHNYGWISNYPFDEFNSQHFCFLHPESEVLKMSTQEIEVNFINPLYKIKQQIIDNYLK